jgi:N-glycosylase/DNA lyase
MSSRWKKIGAPDSFSLIGIEETLIGGQSFAWSSSKTNHWVGLIRQSLVHLKWSEGQLHWLLESGKKITEEEICHYLWLDDSYVSAVNNLPWRSDPVLGRAMAKYSGLRILRQPMEEVLMVFILSSAKSIPQIKQLCQRVYKLFGNEVAPGFYSFPGWSNLKNLQEEEARKLGMGYRAKYLVGTAQYLSANADFLKEVQSLPYFEARSKLMKLPGVGPKVADCILLFGAEKNQAFPIDTWILQSLEKQYGMRGWKLPQMEEFARIHFGEHAGLAQQFLFSYQRNLP